MQSATLTHSNGLQVIEGEGQDPLIGTTIDGRYEIQKVLGEGGMGLVYRCRHVVLNKLLAMKVLRPDVSKDQEIITRFRQEAQSASAIGNQHIIDISDFGALPDGSTYFIMEFLDGRDLTRAVEKESPLSEQLIIHVATQLCDALGAAHDAGIVHRDLKPDNIYLIKRGGDSDFVKVLDFGIAKVGGASSKLTRAGQVFGTPHYMSPEQCGGVQLDHRTDLYAIGIILYEMITGRTPFDADNLMAILSKHLYEQPKPPRELRPDCSVELESIVLRCIAKKPDERYANCHEMRDDLKRLAAGAAVSSVGRTYSALPNVPSTTVPVMEAPKPKSSTPMIAGGLALLLGVGGVGGYFATRPAPRPPAPAATPAPVAITTTAAEINAAAAAAAAGQAQPMVRLVTEPEGAEVWSGDSMLGQTPLDVPRPARGQTMDIELRAPGHDARVITISGMTLAPQLRFTLAESRQAHTGGGHAPSTGMAPAGAAPAAAPRPAARPAAHPDLDNPWE